MEKEEIESLRLILMQQKEINLLNLEISESLILMLQRQIALNLLNIEDIELLRGRLKNLSRIVFIVSIHYL